LLLTFVDINTMFTKPTEINMAQRLLVYGQISVIDETMMILVKYYSLRVRPDSIVMDNLLL